MAFFCYHEKGSFYESLYTLTNLQTTNILLGYMFIAQDAKEDQDYN